MADVFTKKKRSEIMSRIKGRGNALTEMRLISIFRKHGISGWRRHFRLFGSPDFVFPKARIAIFVDGCFWHGCPIHGTRPASNRSFWERKLSYNKSRDHLVNRTLRKDGWVVLRIWQHQLRDNKSVAVQVSRTLSSRNLSARNKLGK